MPTTLKFLYVWLGCLVATSAFAQEDYYQKLEQEAFAVANKFEYAKSLEKAYEMYGAFPDNVNGHVLVAFNLINLGRYKDANGYINASLAIDPTNSSGYFNAAYYYALDGNVEDAKKYLLETLKMYPPSLALKDVTDEMRRVGQNNNRAAVFNQLADWYQQQFNSTHEKYPTLRDLVEEFQKDATKIRSIADRYAEDFTKLKWPEMALSVYGYSCMWLRELGYPSDARDVGEAGYSYFVKNGFGNNPYQATFMINELMKTYSYLGNDERVIKFTDEIMKLSNQLPVHVHDVNVLLLTSEAYDRLGNNKEARRFAIAAYQLAEKSGNRYGATSAANSLCASYNIVQQTSDINDAVYYGEQALQLAMKFKFELLMGAIMNNLALAYYKIGTREGQEKAARMYGSLVAIYKDKKMWSNAALALNNEGALMMHTGGYEYAVEYFQESVDLAKRDMGLLSPEDKLTFYQSQMSAYQFLAVCYAKLGNAEKTYEAIEGSRSRVLTERLAKGREIAPGTIADLQKILQPDEAAVFYSLFSAHEVVILVVTKKYSKVVFNSDDTFIGGIKAKYFKQIAQEHGERRGADLTNSGDTRVAMADFQKVTQLTRKFFERPGVGDEILKEYLQGYYKFLILPVLNRLTGVKSLLISPDGVLNYLPFEALQMHDGKYLVEKFSIRYLNSTGALQLIEARQYSQNRKPLLAMGGAVYEATTTPKPTIKTQQDLNALELEVQENKAAGRSQRRAYAALFGNGPLNALPGTMEEVKTISKYVSNAETYSGSDFTENRLKSMSKSGSLKQFKVLHLATHGFVVEEIPDLSGVAMSIFANEQAGEDGFLNVEEIAALNLNADLTILSACQTALGKIYTGEGVTGLTQSLLVAGSNAALVSLWPVNDTSTAQFMSDLYKESAKGKPYAQVVAEIKRKFIKGDYGDTFKHPNFWAPFVYVGK